MMGISAMTLEQLESIEVTSVEFGRDLAQELQNERARILKLMTGNHSNYEWQVLADRRYDLHKVRLKTLLTIGRMVSQNKKIAGGK